MLPKELCKLVPKSHLMSEAEWRSIGVQQSQGWIHYMKHDPGNAPFICQVTSATVQKVAFMSVIQQVVRSSLV